MTETPSRKSFALEGDPRQRYQGQAFRCDTPGCTRTWTHAVGPKVRGQPTAPRYLCDRCFDEHRAWIASRHQAIASVLDHQAPRIRGRGLVTRIRRAAFATLVLMAMVAACAAALVGLEAALRWIASP